MPVVVNPEERPDQDFDCSGIAFPGYLRDIPCPESPMGSVPDAPTGTLLERTLIVALRRTSADGHSVGLGELAAETGSDQAEINQGLTSLMSRGVIDRKTYANGYVSYRLKQDYRMQVSTNYVRVFPNAEIEGGRKVPMIDDDVRSLHHLLYGIFPIESILDYLSYLPEFLTDEARQAVALARAAEAEGEAAAEQLSSGEDFDQRD